MSLATKDLSFTYTGGKSLFFPDIQCSTGENILILGASGSGKTSLLHLIAGILRPSKGSITINNETTSALSSRDMDAFRGRHIGMVFQQHFFLQGISVWENLVAAQRLPGCNSDEQHLDSLLHTLGIMDLRFYKPEQLSQGEQQRFSIARALANKPLLILADEPTASLDDQNCRIFVDLIGSTSQIIQTSWLIATHDQRLKEHFRRVYNI
jgi:ABC-type lipoprotein export system ATPase subunit